jgi:hypothetical protein
MAKTAQDYLAEIQAENAKKQSAAKQDYGVSDLQAKAAQDKWLANFWKPTETGYRNAASTLGDQRYNKYNEQAISSNNNLARAVQASNAAASGGSGGMSDIDAKAEANKREAYDLARGGVTRVTEDPVDKMIRDQLASVVSGKNVPFNDEVRNAMFSEQADMGAAANSNRAEKILAQATERGLSPNDPAVQAALRNSLTQQQLGAQGARQDIAKVANLANFNASQTGTRDLAGINESYQNRITGAEDRLRGMLWTERFNEKTAMPGMAQTPMTLPTYSQYNRRNSNQGDMADFAVGGVPAASEPKLYGGTAGPQNNVFSNATQGFGQMVEPNGETQSGQHYIDWEAEGNGESDPYQMKVYERRPKYNKYGYNQDMSL